jgi:hypothetical protein
MPKFVPSDSSEANPFSFYVETMTSVAKNSYDGFVSTSSIPCCHVAKRKSCDVRQSAKRKKNCDVQQSAKRKKNCDVQQSAKRKNCDVQSAKRKNCDVQSAKRKSCDVPKKNVKRKKM